ncbi:MAG: M56 family metallopeptidase [Bacteroidota bacterium]
MNWLPEPWIQTVGWTLVHSLWVITLLALGLRLVLSLIPSKFAQLRYLAAVSTLFCSIIALGVIGFYVHQPTTTHTSQVSEHPVTIVLYTPDVADSIASISIIQQINRRLQVWLTPHLSGILIIWFSGVLFFLIRGAGNLLYLRRLTHHDTQPISAQWQEKVSQLSSTLKISRSLSVRVSPRIRAPFVVGFLKPVILLPISAFSQLSPEQLEAILAHELAHIRRWDDVVNWMQATVETILFYHPALWWISQLIRDEREKCCDDLAVATCGNAVVYAKALTQLETLPDSTSSFALALSRSGNGLLARVERLLQPGSQTSKSSPMPATIMILLIAALLSSFWLDPIATQSSTMSSPVYSGAILGLNPGSEPETTSPSLDSPWKPTLPDWLKEESIVLDTIPAESDTVITKNSKKAKRNAYRYYFSPGNDRYEVDSLQHIFQFDSLSNIYAFSSPGMQILSFDSLPKTLVLPFDSIQQGGVFAFSDIDLDVLEDIDVDVDLDVLEDIGIIIDSTHGWGHNFNLHFSDTLPMPAIGAIPAMPAPPVIILNDSLQEYSMQVYRKAMRQYEQALSHLDSSAFRDEILEQQLRSLEAQQRNYERQMRMQERQAEQLQRWQERMEAWEERQQELQQRYEERVREMSKRQEEQLLRQEKEWKKMMEEMERKEMRDRN